jgi:hypothetical protein
LFTSIYQGTLRGNSHCLLVFTNLLAHCDKSGEVDIHPRAIAEEVGLTIEQVRAALLMLEAPDEESRSPEEDGRRILRKDEHRAWGWVVVNYLKYRSIRDEDDRREQNRLAQERWRNKNKPASAAVDGDKPIQKQKQKQIQETHPPTPRKRGRSGGWGFDAFWDVYPNKTAKQAAAKAFDKIAPSTDLLDEILQAVARQKTWPKWVKDGGQYIPHPATWLNAHQWLDEQPAVVVAAPGRNDRGEPLTVPSAAGEKTAAYLAQEAEAAKRANSPEAQAARLAAIARVKGPSHV